MEMGHTEISMRINKLLITFNTESIENIASLQYISVSSQLDFEDLFFVKKNLN